MRIDETDLTLLLIGCALLVLPSWVILEYWLLWVILVVAIRLIWRRFWANVPARRAEQQWGCRPVRRLGMCESWLFGAARFDSVMIVGSISVRLPQDLPRSTLMQSIRNALFLMLARNPILRATVCVNRSDSNNPWFFLMDDPFTAAVIEFFSRQETTVDEQHERLMQAGLPHNAFNTLPWRLVAILPSSPDDSTLELVMSCQHTILDGTSNQVFLLMLVEALAEVRNLHASSASSLQPASPPAARVLNKVHTSTWPFSSAMADLMTANWNAAFPPCFEDLLKHNGSWQRHLTFWQKWLPDMPRSIVGELSEVLSPAWRTIEARAPVQDRRDRVLHSVVEAEALERLLARCKEEQVTVHAALLACTTTAYLATFDVDAGHFALDSPVSLTGMLPPPYNDRRTLFVRISEQAQHIDDLRPFLQASRQSQPACLGFAHEYHKQLHHDPRTKLPGSAVRNAANAAGRAAFLSLGPITDLILLNPGDCGRFAPVVVSNGLDISSTSPELASGRHVFLVEDLRLTQASKCLGPEFFMFFATFGRRLFITLSYTTPLHSEAKMKEFEERLLGTLAEF